MARYEYVILTQAVEGKLEEFERWYDEVHLRDVLKIPGVVSARRSRICSIKNTAVDGPAWNSLAIYELEADDPEKVKQAISDAAGTAAMTMSAALEKDGILQIIAQPLS
ncbi:MAG: hypothetical protein ACI9G5_002800 [Paracoccaceae bacterium]|jgi:hypothetical protein